MKSARSILFIALTWLVLIGAPWVSIRAGETVDSIKKAIEETCGKHTSITYRVTCVTIIGPSKTVENATYEAALINGKWLKRTEALIDPQQPGKPVKVARFFIDDGVHAYNVNEYGDEKTATVQATLAANECKAAENFFEELAVGNEITVLPDEVFDGVPVYVLTAKSEKKNFAGRFHLSKESGVVMRSEQVFSKTFNTSTIWTVSDLKLDSAIPPERFVFTPPAGVTMQDITPKPGAK